MNLTNALMWLLAARYCSLSITGRIEHPEHPTLVESALDIAFIAGFVILFGLVFWQALRPGSGEA